MKETTYEEHLKEREAAVMAELESLIPGYVLTGYELIRQEFGHVDDIPRDIPMDDRVRELRHHPAVIAKRSEVIGRLTDLTGENQLWRIYHVYTSQYGSGLDLVGRATVIVEVYDNKPVWNTW
jgi:hypothetical protein